MKINRNSLLSFIVIVIVSVEISLYGEGGSYVTNTITIPRPELFATIRDDQMQSRLKKAAGGVMLAQKDMNEIRKGVRVGSTKIVSNRGLWCAVLEDQSSIRMAVFASQDKRSRITNLTRRVWTDSTREHESHVNGYEILFGENGSVETFMSRDGKEMLTFFPNGRLRRFSASLDEGQYSAEWDNHGKLIGEARRSQEFDLPEGVD